MAESIPEDLFAGEPVIETRWRLQNGALPLKNRHLRALAARDVTSALVSWAHQHLEWTLAEGAMEQPDGVLVLDVDAEGRAVMSIAPFEPLPPLSAALLLDRVAGHEADPVEDEVIWTCRDGRLYVLSDAGKPRSGANSLAVDLARTLHLEPTFEGHAPVAEALSRLAPADELFLVSDEFGIVAAADHDGPMARELASCYAKLLTAAKPDRMGQALGRHRA